MSKALSAKRGLVSLQVSARFRNEVDWAGIPAEQLQEVNGLPSEEFRRRFTEFLRNGARSSSGGMTIYTVAFDPKTLGSWGFWHGTKNGNGLHGQRDYDERNDDIHEIDFGDVEFASCLGRNEEEITGEEKLARLKDSGRIRYGTSVMMGLFKDLDLYKEKSVLERLYRTYGIGYIDFFGDVLREPGHNRCVMSIRRVKPGIWEQFFHCLYQTWSGSDLSVISSASAVPAVSEVS
jgi:hypothetical protein